MEIDGSLRKIDGFHTVLPSIYIVSEMFMTLISIRWRKIDWLCLIRINMFNNVSFNCYCLSVPCSCFSFFL